jgi:hypothetical protein
VVWNLVFMTFHIYHIIGIFMIPTGFHSIIFQRGSSTTGPWDVGDGQRSADQFLDWQWYNICIYTYIDIMIQMWNGTICSWLLPNILGWCFLFHPGGYHPGVVTVNALLLKGKISFFQSVNWLQGAQLMWQEVWVQMCVQETTWMYLNC